MKNVSFINGKESKELELRTIDPCQLEEPAEHKLSDLVTGMRAILKAFTTMALHSADIYLRASYKLMQKSWEGTDDYYREYPKRIGKAIDEACLKGVLQAKTKVHGTVDPIGDDEIGIHISNHPTINGIFPGLRYITEDVQTKIAGVSKRENLWLPHVAPFLAWPSWIAGCGIFVNREDPKSAVASIRKACKTILRPGTGVWLYPDATRPTPEKIEQARERFRYKIPDIEDFTQTGVPRSRGTNELLKGTEGKQRKIIDHTFSFNRNDNTIGDAAKLRGATFHIDSEDVTDQIPMDDEKALRTWLVDRWRRKNRLIEHWKNEPDTIE